MEVQGALDIFRNSVTAYNVRYTKYLGDGDSKSYQAVQELNPYGENVSIDKLECIGQMGTSKKEWAPDCEGLRLAIEA